MSGLSFYLATQRAIDNMSGIITRNPRFTAPKLLVGCFDESGKWKDSEGVFVFAGGIFPQPELQALTAKWYERITQDDLSHTSMKEAMHFHGPYAKWKSSPEKRDSVIRDLTTLIMDATMLRVSSPLDRSTSDAFKALPQQVRKSLGNEPYYAAFESCILGALHSRTDTLLHIVCDLSVEYSEKCVTTFHKIRSARPDVKERCVGLAFADDERHVGLQIADLIAYCARADALRGTKQPAPLVQEIIHRFATQDATEHSVIYHSQGKGIGDATFE